MPGALALFVRLVPEGMRFHAAGVQPGVEQVDDFAFRSEERRVGKVTGVQTCALPISSSPMSSNTRLMIGWVYHDPNMIPIRPRAGSRRQYFQCQGRSRSSSDWSQKACVSTPRASSQVLSRLTTSLLDRKSVV